MTPQSPSGRVHAPRNLVRRAATVVAASMLGGVPLVAQALTDEPAPAPDPVSRADRQVTAVPADRISAPTAVPLDGQGSPSEPVAAPDVAPPPDPALEAMIVVLTDTYAWDERGPRVEVLQQTLGVAADGWYGQATHRARRSALEFLGLPTDDLPVPVVAPGPSEGQWAALRECEAGGDYSITNPSGKYRGAYQFDRSTWNSVAERNAPDLVGVDPAAASPADQDVMALALYTERGARPWPHCGRHLR